MDRVHSLVTFMFLKTVPLSSAKLFETRRARSELLAELSTTLKATASSMMMRQWRHITRRVTKKSTSTLRPSSLAPRRAGYPWPPLELRPPSSIEQEAARVSRQSKLKDPQILSKISSMVSTT